MFYSSQIGNLTTSAQQEKINEETMSNLIVILLGGSIFIFSFLFLFSVIVNDNNYIFMLML